jgi:hypothetical protein
MDPSAGAHGVARTRTGQVIGSVTGLGRYVRNVVAAGCTLTGRIAAEGPRSASAGPQSLIAGRIAGFARVHDAVAAAGRNTGGPAGIRSAVVVVRTPALAGAGTGGVPVVTRFASVLNAIAAPTERTVGSAVCIGGAGVCTRVVTRFTGIRHAVPAAGADTGLPAGVGIVVTVEDAVVAGLAAVYYAVTADGAGALAVVG